MRAAASKQDALQPVGVLEYEDARSKEKPKSDDGETESLEMLI